MVVRSSYPGRLISTVGIFIPKTTSLIILIHPLHEPMPGAHVSFHDDVIKWKHFPRCWPFVRGIHRSVTQSFDVFFDLRLSKQSWGWWFEPASCSLWRRCNVSVGFNHIILYTCYKRGQNQHFILDMMSSSIQQANPIWFNQWPMIKFIAMTAHDCRWLVGS